MHVSYVNKDGAERMEYSDNMHPASFMGTPAEKHTFHLLERSAETGEVVARMHNEWQVRYVEAATFHFMELLPMGCICL